MNQTTAGLENISFNSESRYSVAKKIGEGGMGIVFLAEKDTGGVIDHVVCKCLRTINPEEEEKLKQEASIATMLRHENVVKTYGMEMVPIQLLPQGMQDSIQRNAQGGILDKMKKESEKKLPLLIMDYIKGIDFHSLLVQHLKKNLLFPIPLAAFVISRIASALSYAHTYIIHRDISPENILISAQGVCKLTDFGVAVLAEKQPEYWAGKLMYMAPEQICNDPIDERADIFALGLVAYQAVTGIPLMYASPRLSFEDQAHVIYGQMKNSIIPPHRVRKDIPKELSMIITRMLSFAPEHRYQRASMVVNDLEKEYLYAKGFGPTNNSLAAYIDIFSLDFTEYNEDQLQQLSFLKDSEGRIALKRNLDVENYTKLGQKLLADRKDSLVVSRLRSIWAKSKKTTTKKVSQVEEKDPYLKVKYFDNVVEAFSLKQGKVTVGRSARNLVVLPSKIVSGHHACFYVDDRGETLVEDLASHNGTLVNAKRIERKYLNEGDKIQIGHTILFFLMEPHNKTSELVISINDNINMDDLKNCKDITLQFLATEENLSQINEIVGNILSFTSIGAMKQNVVPPAVYEAARLFSGEVTNEFMSLRVVQARNYISFRCSSPSKSFGYETFLSAIHRRMNSSNGVGSSVPSLEPEELALSLILKVFDRIEIFRFSREILMTNFFSN